MYGILGIPAKLVFLVLKHALKFLGLWKGLSEGAKALKDGAKKLLKTGVSVVKDFASDLFGGKKKVLLTFTRSMRPPRPPPFARTPHSFALRCPNMYHIQCRSYRAKRKLV